MKIGLSYVSSLYVWNSVELILIGTLYLLCPLREDEINFAENLFARNAVWRKGHYNCALFIIF